MARRRPRPYHDLRKAGWAACAPAGQRKCLPVVIDIHTHTRTPLSGSPEQEVALMKRCAAQSGVDRVVHLFNVSETRQGPPDAGHIRANNDWAMRLVERDPEFFSAFCYLNPANDPAFSLEEIERTVVYGNLVGVKLWAWVKATDPRLDPIMEKLAQIRAPLLFHSWYNQLGRTYDETTPAEIAVLARRYPGVTIVAAHMGGGGWRGVLDVKECPNVLVDTSGSQPGAALVEYAVRELGAERILFGSDWPGRDMAVQKARVLGARISAEEKALILGGNAARLLGLRKEGKVGGRA